MRTLAIDIETRPHVGYTWGLFDQNISLSQLKEPGGVICFAAKFLGERKMHFASDFHDGHEEMVGYAHALLDEADVVMHYNGKRFDIPHLQREFVLLGLAPPAPYQQIDLLHVMRRRFKFASNKLEHVAVQLGLEGKVKHEGFELWIKCLEGDERAWARMRRYNKQDVKLLEELYAIVQPWIQSHPNRGLYEEIDECPTCGEGPMQRRGFAFTNQSKYQRWQCQACGSWHRSSRRVEGSELAQVSF